MDGRRSSPFRPYYASICYPQARAQFSLAGFKLLGVIMLRTEPSVFPNDLAERADALLKAYRRHGLKIALAESCTGGLIAALLTEIPGSSLVFERGFVTYSNDAKHESLGVSASLLAEKGAVNEQVVREMATGALKNSRADVAVAVSGVAGPKGGSEERPVGLVHFACAGPQGRLVHVERRFGDLGRAKVRLATVHQALELLARAIGEE